MGFRTRTIALAARHSAANHCSAGHLHASLGMRAGPASLRCQMHVRAGSQAGDLPDAAFPGNVAMGPI